MVGKITNRPSNNIKTGGLYIAFPLKQRLWLNFFEMIFAQLNLEIRVAFNANSGFFRTELSIALYKMR